MGKIVPKKKSSRSIIRSHVLNVGSHIDNVKYSLDHLIFSQSKEEEIVFFKKRIKFIVVTTTLLMIVGFLFSPKGKAEISTFYPSSCLGGWNNPRNVEGAPETATNDGVDFTKENSAILPEGTHADIYCGNFIGEIEEGTRPTKILVSLAWDKGEAPLLVEEIRSESFASSTGEILDTASTTEVTYTSLDVVEGATSTTSGEATSSQINPEIATTTETSSDKSVVDTVINLVQDTLQSFLNNNEASSTTSEQTSPQTETIVEPQVTPKQDEPISTPKTEEVPVTESESKPTSLLIEALEQLASYFVKTVYAEEVATSSPVNLLNEEQTVSPVSVATTSEISTTDTVASGAIDSTTTPQENTESVSEIKIDTQISSEATTTEEIITPSTLSGATTTEVSATTTEIALDSDADDDSQNNFLEVLYTFDGVVWKSLGKVNETSMKYRTFEIPVTATTSWGNMGQLQIKVQTLQRLDVIPTLYLDAMKVDVLYETAVIHEHPDFARDTVLKDKSDDGVRVVNIINSDTSNNEIWYTTIETQGDYGVAPGTWVKVDLSQSGQSYKLLDIYGQNIFWLDEASKLLWVTSLQRETNNGIVLMDKASTTVSFMKNNGEEWVFEYNSITKASLARMKN